MQLNIILSYEANMVRSASSSTGTSLCPPSRFTMTAACRIGTTRSSLELRGLNWTRSTGLGNRNLGRIKKHRLSFIRCKMRVLIIKGRIAQFIIPPLKILTYVFISLYSEQYSSVPGKAQLNSKHRS